MISNQKGRVIVLSPNGLYSRFIELLPLFAPNAMTWLFSLVTLFSNTLPSELQEAVQQGEYYLSNLSTLLTSNLQKQKLQRLREQAVVIHKKLQDKSKQMKKSMTTFVTIHGSSSNNLQTDTNCLYSNYLAEQTLRGNSDTTTREDIPLVAGIDGKIYPQNPSNKYISRFPDEFTGFLGCGYPYHYFKSYPRKGAKYLKIFFDKNLWLRLNIWRWLRFTYSVE